MIEILVASEKQRITTEACASEKASVQKSDMGNSGHGGVAYKNGTHVRRKQSLARRFGSTPLKCRIPASGIRPARQPFTSLLSSCRQVDRNISQIVTHSLSRVASHRTSIFTRRLSIKRAKSSAWVRAYVLRTAYLPTCQSQYHLASKMRFTPPYSQLVLSYSSSSCPVSSPSV